MVKEGVNVPQYLSDIVGVAVDGIPENLAELDTSKLPTVKAVLINSTEGDITLADGDGPTTIAAGSKEEFTFAYGGELKYTVGSAEHSFTLKYDDDDDAPEIKTADDVPFGVETTEVEKEIEIEVKETTKSKTKRSTKFKPLRPESKSTTETEIEIKTPLLEIEVETETKTESDKKEVKESVKKETKIEKKIISVTWEIYST